MKQGAILSPILYCVYTNRIFQEIRRMNIGCCKGRNYVGVLGYADDLYLMVPCIDGLQEMLKVCEKYAEDHNLKFSIDVNPNKSKTKCMAYLHKERELRNLTLCGNKIPWVKSGKHLGMRIDAIKDNILTRDIIEKRARYINSNNELVQEFAYTSSDTKHSLTAFSIVMRTGLISGICTGKKQACSSTPGVLLLGKCIGLIEGRTGIS